MTAEENERANVRNSAQSSREAAAWALKLLGDSHQNSIAAAMELDEHLKTLNLDRRAVLLVQLANLVGRTGVASDDVATLKVKLRMMSTMTVPGE
jgi:hypothetical protein